jgi:ParB/RepB/Spo0J family partition protein
MRLERIRCTDIRPDPCSGGYQPQEIEALADSIRLHGVLRPVLLRPTSDGYVIVHGECRWRAAQVLGLKVIPAVVVQDHRRDLNLAASIFLADRFAQHEPSRTAATSAYEFAANDD